MATKSNSTRPTLWKVDFAPYTLATELTISATPVHTGDGVDYIGNKVDRIGDSVDRDKLLNWTLLPVCCQNQ